MSLKHIQRALGALWLIVGLLQVQPQMFTMRMVPNILLPIVSGQPAPVATSLLEISHVIAQNLTIANLLFAVIQVEIGLFLLLDLWVRETVIASLVWSLLVWYGGEGMGLLLTGHASVLTGAPGPVLFYALLGLLVYPRATVNAAAPSADHRASLISLKQLRWILAGFWGFAALLQLQPYWWQPGNLPGVISDLIDQGGLDKVLVDPTLQPLAAFPAALEVPLNGALILAFLGLGIALVVARTEQLRTWLVVSIVFSVLMWWGTQAFGLLFTGLATDVSSGPLLVLTALACWPSAAQQPAQTQPDHTVELLDGKVEQPEKVISLA